MKRVWRFVLFWRYLLVACLMSAAAGTYLFIGFPCPVMTPQPLQTEPPPQLPPLRVRYQKVEYGMTESQVQGILGPPQQCDEIDVIDTKLMVWHEGEQTVTIWFLWGETVRVFRKQFIAGSEKALVPGKPRAVAAH